MTEKFKKIDRPFVLSDSSVNEYGFRLLTSGYQLESFQKNPIGYYMHRREDGIVLKWEDLRVEDDLLTGTPVINLCNARGPQTYDEVENGFLNAASVGHIVVLEYSTDKELMAPGQTGPTITRWYNKECSLVDIPGNSNALTRLYDAHENELNLADFTVTAPITAMNGNLIKELSDCLKITNGTDEKGLVAAVQCLAENAEKLANENLKLQQRVDELSDAQSKMAITTLLDRALEDRKITRELKNKLACDYAGNADGLKGLLAAMPAYRSIAEMLQQKQKDRAEGTWEWDDYEKHDPAGKKLKELRANDPDRYKEIFDKKFNA